ncbi:MAG: BlaI/MecI/CopY family transcriptional regulator [Acidobacteria bacterium]|nr:BlaI/MecI/CopY family transcriptional regulator [Acidobacteriota bacterium]
MRRARGELEGEVLTTLWAADRPLTAAEVQGQLAGELAATTVITILSRLMEKGQVERRRAAGERVYRYAVTRERAEHAAEQMHAFLGTGDQRRATLARFITRLSRADRRALADLLRRGEGDDGRQ